MSGWDDTVHDVFIIVLYVRIHGCISNFCSPLAPICSWNCMGLWDDLCRVVIQS